MTEIISTPEFDKEYKRLKKKYQSLPDDLANLEKELIKNPHLGIDLGNNFRKIRMAITAKNKGKSGGARVIG
jgi:mRNA-degrading endonuclease RelE of RelBE toxin-antitoxin system